MVIFPRLSRLVTKKTDFAIPSQRDYGLIQAWKRGAKVAQNALKEDKNAKKRIGRRYGRFAGMGA